jgi:hypothetical protein
MPLLSILLDMIQIVERTCYCQVHVSTLPVDGEEDHSTHILLDRYGPRGERCKCDHSLPAALAAVCAVQHVPVQVAHGLAVDAAPRDCIFGAMPAKLHVIMLGDYACRVTRFDWSAVSLVRTHSMIFFAFTTLA